MSNKIHSNNNEQKKRGPGQPPKPAHLKRRSKHFKLAPDVCDWLDRQDKPQTELVETAIRQTYGIDK